MLSLISTLSPIAISFILAWIWFVLNLTSSVRRVWFASPLLAKSISVQWLNTFLCEKRDIPLSLEIFRANVRLHRRRGVFARISEIFKPRPARFRRIKVQNRTSRPDDVSAMCRRARRSYTKEREFVRCDRDFKLSKKFVWKVKSGWRINVSGQYSIFVVFGYNWGRIHLSVNIYRFFSWKIISEM